MKYIEILNTIYSYLYDNKEIKNQKEFANMIGETNTGWGDLKLERKKVNIKHLRAIALKFPEFNRSYIFLGEGKLTEKDNRTIDNYSLMEDYTKNLQETIKLLKEKIDNK